MPKGVYLNVSNDHTDRSSSSVQLKVNLEKKSLPILLLHLTSQFKPASLKKNLEGIPVFKERGYLRELITRFAFWPRKFPEETVRFKQSTSFHAKVNFKAVDDV